MKRTLHLSHTADDALTMLYVDRIKEGKKTSMSALVDEAVIYFCEAQKNKPFTGTPILSCEKHFKNDGWKANNLMLVHDNRLCQWLEPHDGDKE